jgi:hypothetical protein
MNTAEQFTTYLSIHTEYYGTACDYRRRLSCILGGFMLEFVGGSFEYRTGILTTTPCSVRSWFCRSLNLPRDRANKTWSGVGGGLASYVSLLFSGCGTLNFRHHDL